MDATDRTDRTDTTDKNQAAPNAEALIPKHGGYRNLKSFKVSQLVYDLTVLFCSRYVDRRSRTHDQMVQAARSGVQNIAEGSMASGTSRKMELKLTGVARASLEELRLDYEDFLRQRNLPFWVPDDPRRHELIVRRVLTLEEVAQWSHQTHSAPNPSPKPTYPEIVANGALALIATACSLLDRQLAAQASTFEQEGGFTERLHRVRTRKRANS